MPTLPRDRGSELERVFSRPAVRALAGPRTFERGEDYAAGGLVKRPRITDSAAEANVQGSHPYQVRLWVVGGDPHFSCTCPVGSEGSFCKHAVALALVATSPDTAGQRLEAKPPVDAGAYLKSLDQGQLIRLVTD
ncbi:MAG: SWIM zinc finger family protein, partial [Sulfobacillus sp.]